MNLRVHMEKLSPKAGDIVVIRVEDAGHEELAAFAADGGFSDVKAAFPDVAFVLTNGQVRFEIEGQEAIVQVTDVDETPPESITPEMRAAAERSFVRAAS